ncbi:MAG: hypothetical protein ACI841_000674 [Planctomycetota bacterium]|jgi:hypothetical protein
MTAWDRPDSIAFNQADNLEHIHRWCVSHDCQFMAVVLPRHYQYSDREAPQSWENDRYTQLGPHCEAPFRFFEELQGQAGYPIVSLLDPFKDPAQFPTCFEGDPHWTPAGHGLAARSIAAALWPSIKD